MSGLPRISGRDCIKMPGKVGFFPVRQHGSHIILRRSQPMIQLVVPDHKELDRGTLRAIIRQSGLNLEEFLRLF